MTTIIDQAGQATRAIKAEFSGLATRIKSMDLTCNALGVLADPGMIGADIDEYRRILDRIEGKWINTQWPKAADYAEV